MFQFAPAIVRDLDLIPFPRPILSCQVHDSWDYLKMKVPNRDGNEISGISQDGVSISIEGQIGSVSGSLKLSEAEMLSAAETLREALNASGETGYVLSLFNDDADNRRYFQNCLTTRFEIDFSNPAIYSYSVSIFAADPTLYG
ncbi:hypothetical protein [Planctomicrobium sp. SH527]|uniref:hypothetical protein n=1 Tax=Planctomicrobium sp. SH527 TaxID=3448123 RepID=UPI003F5BBDC4